jgi:DNA-binding HxlR family transcriptional regulator
MKVKRSYGQYCAVARALDLIGERWTLLLVRELLLGPRRYTDLLRGLPGIGTNLLADRLRELEAAGLVARRTLPPPASSSVYELTQLGEGLRATVLELGRWGGRLLGEPAGEMRPGWYVVSMTATFRPDAAAGLDETYELRVDDDAFALHVHDGTVDIVPPVRADLVLTTDLEGFVGLLAGHVAPDDPRIAIEGEPEQLDRLLEIFRWPSTM